MSSCVAELDGILQSMLGLKAPGVTSSKISSVTALCNANIQSESVLIQRIYTHFKKAPATHKLGVLYVVDSVTRAWVEQAKKKGQAIGLDAPHGTFAAGVSHVTELLLTLMTDLINSAPDEQKVRIGKLVDIWERGNTFPAELLSKVKQKLEAPAVNAPQSATPTGSPPKDFIPLGDHNLAAGAAPDTSKILKALADMAKTNTAAGMPPQASSGNVTNLQNAYAHTMPSSVNSAPSVPSFGQAVGVPGAASGANQYGGISSAPPAAFPQNVTMQGGLPMQANPIMPQAQGAQGPSPEVLQQQVQLLQMLQAQGVPQDQWATVLSVLMKTGAVGGTNNAAPQPTWSQNGFGGREDASRDRNGGYNDQYNLRSPSGRYRDHRSRSRSPSGYDRRRGPSPPRRRDSPTYGDYGRDGRGGRNGRGRGDNYRQRSPDRYRRSDSPPRRQDQALPPSGPKRIEYDNSLPPNNIKVLSRTLFVGGVTSSEEVLRGIFASFGIVQTCIVNVDKRHAFVKMLNRTDALSAKEGMERYRSADMQLRTRWGVGFGPRDCSDYQTGISIIPIDRLTDADRKWMLTAEYGGTGGRSIEPGMVVEEPDIEIGAGVSSKAISRRMQTDKGGNQGPRSSRDGQSVQPPNEQRYRQPERNDQERNHNNNNNMGNNNIAGIPPPVPAFGGFQFPGMPAGFQFPPGFAFPGATPTQPPPPGAT